MAYRSFRPDEPLPSLFARFGVRSAAQLGHDVRLVFAHQLERARGRSDRFAFNLASAGLLRPDLSLPAWAGLVPADGVAPIYNLFDRSGGGRGFRTAVSRSTNLRDHRGGRLSYDEHDGTDLVCPPGTPLCAAAPGIVVALRNNFLRGGLTACVDHGDGVVTQYTHLTRLRVPLGRRVARGEPIADSGTSGFDLMQFFPLVPPHIHFMVFVRGRPVDPYRVPGDPDEGGAWTDGNDPRTTAAPLPDDPAPAQVLPQVDLPLLTSAIARCGDPRIAAELRAQPDALARAAVLEDSLHHDRAAWPATLADEVLPALRPGADPRRICLTLPLPAALYQRARFADTPITRP